MRNDKQEDILENKHLYGTYLPEGIRTVYLEDALFYIEQMKGENG